jgi:hypothetical protein
MSAKDIVTAYKVAVPGKQTQDLPGLDKNIIRTSSRYQIIRRKLTSSLAGVEYTAQEFWDNEGKPYLQEYVGSGK